MTTSLPGSPIKEAPGPGPACGGLRPTRALGTGARGRRWLADEFREAGEAQRGISLITP